VATRDANTRGGRLSPQPIVSKHLTTTLFSSFQQVRLDATLCDLLKHALGKAAGAVSALVVQLAILEMTDSFVPRLKTGMLCLAILTALAAVTLADDSPIRAMPPSVASPMGPFSEASPSDGPPDIDQPLRSEGYEPLSAAHLDTPAAHAYYPVVDPLDCWACRILPDGLLYRAHLAGVREPRMGIQLFHEPKSGWLWDGSIGARIGLVRYGTADPIWPEGWQFDVEAGAFPRLSADEDGDLLSADFRYGCAITQRRGRLESKFAFYHLSSHLADEYLVRHPWVERINFSRFGFVYGVAVYPWDAVRVYGEVGYAFYSDGGSEPWELQFGVDYSPLNPSGPWGAPFFAVSGHLRQEVDFGGNFTLQTGWQWRGATGRLARVGLHYLNGQSDQYQFFREHEQQVGIGFWYDF